MGTGLRTRGIALLLTLALLFVCAPSASAADTDGFRCEKTAVTEEDGTVSISLRAFQTGSVPSADIVMVLDVSGSMENSTPVPVSEINPDKDYYIRHIRVIEMDGEQKNFRVNVRVHNTAAPGEEPVWVGQLEENGPDQQVTPGNGLDGTYQFYTGAMDALRAAATDFVHSIAQNAAQYDADHRIAVVEFSSPVPKGADALCTHQTQPDPYYANILTGSGSASGALVSAKNAEQELADVFASLTAAGPTYSDDAMTQAKRILAASTASRRVAILFTDGGPGSYGWDYDLDTTALSTANGAIAAAGEMKQSGVQIYTIGVFNAENLAGETGKKNRSYLSLVSSNYPDAESMDSTGTQQTDGYSSVGDLNMDLSGAFAGISAVLGEPVESAQVRDTVSRYFYLTDAQRQALLEAYPQAQITENDDGTTTVSLDSVNFPPVATHANGEVADENDAGIFNMTFRVTPRGDFLGGDGVTTNSGMCGVFSDGVQIAQFTVPKVDVPVNASVLGSLLTVIPQTVYTDQTLTAQMLYEDLSQSPSAAFADVSYTVTDAYGSPFTAQQMTAAGTYTFTVTASAKAGARTYTQQKTVDVTVREDTVDRLEILTPPSKTRYFVGENVLTDGINVYAWMKSGRAIRLAQDQLSVSPQKLTSAGTQAVTVSYGGASSSFDVTADAVVPVSAEVVSSPVNGVFTYRRSPDFTGLSVRVRYNDGHEQIVRDLSQMTVQPQSDARVRRGTQTFRVTTQGVSATFPMQVRLVWWQWLILILLFGWIWY